MHSLKLNCTKNPTHNIVTIAKKVNLIIRLCTSGLYSITTPFHINLPEIVVFNRVWGEFWIIVDWGEYFWVISLS